MIKIEIFDPPMCCSTGLCGPSVDPKLAQFAADVDWLKSKGVTVERYNLAQQPAAFAENEIVKDALKQRGNDCLPLTLLDDVIVESGTYPSRTELAEMAGIAGDTAETGLKTPASCGPGCCK